MQVPAILRGESLKRPLQGAAAALVSPAPRCYSHRSPPRSSERGDHQCSS